MKSASEKLIKCWLRLIVVFLGVMRLELTWTFCHSSHSLDWDFALGGESVTQLSLTRSHSRSLFCSFCSFCQRMHTCNTDTKHFKTQVWNCGDWQKHVYRSKTLETQFELKLLCEERQVDQRVTWPFSWSLTLRDAAIISQCSRSELENVWLN